ncbi:MAG: polyphenol oxidase family protein [Candidatus Omnitrophica bacterium]|nr:polyphenol oxidase family protein [Candidatus Omnitrophota bacterium]
MRLIRKTNCSIIDGFFSAGIVSGFSSSGIAGKMPADIYKICDELSLRSRISFMNQIHSGIVNLIDEPGIYEGDGLFTDRGDNLLVVRTADCLPLIFESEKLNIIGVVHMGWRSAKEKILENIPYKMSSFKVFAGVSLRSCCFEVGEEFYSYGFVPSSLSRKEGKLYFDPLELAKPVLISKGLVEKNFLDINICSFCFGKDFFSYRRDKTSSRTLSFIMKT